MRVYHKGDVKRFEASSPNEAGSITIDGTGLSTSSQPEWQMHQVLPGSGRRKVALREIANDLGLLGDDENSREERGSRCLAG